MKKLFTLLFCILTLGVNAQSYLISQFINVVTPPDSYLFLLENPGLQYFNMSGGQLKTYLNANLNVANAVHATTADAATTATMAATAMSLIGTITSTQVIGAFNNISITNEVDANNGVFTNSLTIGGTNVQIVGGSVPATSLTGTVSSGNLPLIFTTVNPIGSTNFSASAASLRSMLFTTLGINALSAQFAISNPYQQVISNVVFNAFNMGAGTNLMVGIYSNNSTFYVALVVQGTSGTMMTTNSGTWSMIIPPNIPWYWGCSNSASLATPSQPAWMTYQHSP